MKTTHQAIVVKFTPEPAPGSDKLYLVKLPGYQVVTNKEGWDKTGKFLAVHVPPENYVDTTKSEFAWLAKDGKDQWQKVSSCKLRGNLSEGILIPAPEWAKEGDDLTSYLNIQHVEDDPDPDTGANKPDYFKSHNLGKYDIDSAPKFFREFTEGEECVATLKIHGCNCSYTWGTSEDSPTGKVFIRARTTWQTNNSKNECYRAYQNHKAIIDQFCQENPKMILWGEAYGGVGGFRYGLTPGVIAFVAFDIWNEETKSFLDYDAFVSMCQKYNIPRVTEIFRGPYNFEKLRTLAEVPSSFSHPHEGIVIKPVKERKTSKFERLCFKIISPLYKMGTEINLEDMSLTELTELKRKVDDAIAILNGKENVKTSL